MEKCDKTKEYELKVITNRIQTNGPVSPNLLLPLAPALKS